jgi:hypothetical protein
MNKKLNIVTTAVIFTVLASAYATCYLNQVVLCIGNGDEVASSFKSCAPNTVTLSYAIYADENAYKWNVYSVTRGGFHTEDLNAISPVYCDGIVTDPNGNANQNPQNNYGFKSHYIDPCNGGTVSAVNDGSGSDPSFWVRFSSPYTTTATCN